VHRDRLDATELVGGEAFEVTIQTGLAAFVGVVLDVARSRSLTMVM